MRVTIYSVIILLCIWVNSFACSTPDSTSLMPEFRNISWNTSIEKVRKEESSYYLQKFTGFGVETLSFKDEISGIDARVDYTFKNNKLTEGAYIIDHDNSFKEDLPQLLEYLTKQFGNPEFKSGLPHTSDTIWVKENDYGSYRGPSFYWVFADGFIAVLSQKFEDNITLSVLYAHGSSIGRYAENNGVELSQFKIIPLDR